MIPVQMSSVDHKSFRDLQGDLIKADAAKAKEYWEQGVKELGKAPQLKLLVPDDSLSKDLGTFLQSEYKKNLGIDVTVETKTVKARNQQMDEGNYQFGVTGWGADYDDAMTYLDLWANHTPYRGNYENPKYDELIASAKKKSMKQNGSTCCWKQKNPPGRRRGSFSAVLQRKLLPAKAAREKPDFPSVRFPGGIQVRNCGITA